MSIINEALKKTSSQQAAGTSSNPISKLHLEKRKKQTNWGPWFIVGVLLLITGPIVAPLFSSPFKSGRLVAESELASLPAQNTDSLTRKAQFAIEETPLRPVAPIPNPNMNAPHFNLTGLVYSNEQSYCIINDKVVKVGDSIQGATVSEVSPNSVTLEYQGDTIVLSTGE